MQILGPLVEQLGVGGIAGFCVGYFTKKAAKLAAFIVGGLFILIQVAAYYGFVEINWGAAESAVQTAAHSGAIDSAAHRFFTVLVHNLPFGAAFLGGFYLGLKKG